MINFGVQEVSTTKLVTAPGWAYVLDNASQSPLVATQPISRKRARKPTLDIVNPRKSTVQLDIKILRELALLDRENHRDVSVPIPPKQNQDQNVGRGSYGKMTSAVRKILQSNKTFANYLADSEAALANSAISSSSGAAYYTASRTPSQLATPISQTFTLGSAEAIINSNSQRRSSKRRNASINYREVTRGGTVSSKRRNSLAAQASSPIRGKKSEMEQDKKKTLTLEDQISSLISESTIISPHTVTSTNTMLDSHDNHPLLISWIPEMLSEDELRKLLLNPPLSYLEARGPLVEEDQRKPVRHFCERCGYWAKVKCVKCGNRLCNLDCYIEHKEECSRYSL